MNQYCARCGQIIVGQDSLTAFYPENSTLRYHSPCRRLAIVDAEQVEREYTDKSRYAESSAAEIALSQGLKGISG